MKILVMGSGGVGGYFGCLMAKAGFNVHFVARGPHLVAMRERGLKIQGIGQDLSMVVDATDDPSQVGPVDLILFCVKAYDTEDAARLIRPSITDHTVILTLQNGIDNWQRIGDLLGPEKVMAGVAYLFSIISEPGVIRHIGGRGNIIFGELDGSMSQRGERMQELFQKAGIHSELSSSIHGVLWEKFMFICSIAGMTAATRSTIGVIRSHPLTWEMVRGIMEEVKRVAQARSISLEPDIIERSLKTAEAFEGSSKTSLLFDLERGRPLEADALNGAVVRMGEELSIDTPINRFLYACLKVQDLSTAREIKAPEDRCLECNVLLPPESLYCFKCGIEISEYPEEEEEEEITLDGRIPCADGCCIGILGKDNRCGVCGRTPKEVEAEED